MRIFCSLRAGNVSFSEPNSGVLKCLFLMKNLGFRFVLSSQRGRDAGYERSYELSSSSVQPHVIDHVHSGFITPDIVLTKIFPKEKVNLDVIVSSMLLSCLHFTTDNITTFLSSSKGNFDE